MVHLLVDPTLQEACQPYRESIQKILGHIERQEMPLCEALLLVAHAMPRSDVESYQELRKILYEECREHFQHIL